MGIQALEGWSVGATGSAAPVRIPTSAVSGVRLDLAVDCRETTRTGRIQVLACTQPASNRGLHRLLDRAAPVLGQISRDCRSRMAKTETHRNRLRYSLLSDLTDDMVVIDHLTFEEEHHRTRAIRAEVPWTVDRVGGVRSNRGRADTLARRGAFRATPLIQRRYYATIHRLQNLFRNRSSKIRRVRIGHVHVGTVGQCRAMSGPPGLSLDRRLRVRLRPPTIAATPTTPIAPAPSAAPAARNPPDDAS